MTRINVPSQMLFLIQTKDTPKYPFYLVHIGSLAHQHPCYRPSGLPDYQFLYCTSGEGNYIISNNSYTISAGMGILMQPNTVHEYYAIKEPWSTFWIRFCGYATSCLNESEEIQMNQPFYIHNLDHLMYLHQKLYASAKQSGLLNNNEVSLNLYHFLLEYPTCIGTTPGSKPTQAQLSEVIQYIESHYEEDISLETLAKIISVTPQHLCRLFKNTYHMRPLEYIRDYRLSQAKNLLLSKEDITLKEVAFQVGFHDLSYFCATFKRAEGMTPKEFRSKREGASK